MTRSIDAGRALRRARRRGSVTAEGAIVATFLALMFGAVLWAHEGYRAGQRAELDAREALWPQIANGCSDGIAGPAVRARRDYRATSEWIDPAITHRGDAEIGERAVSVTHSRIARRPEALGGGALDRTTRATATCSIPPTGTRLDYRTPAIRLFCDVHPGTGDFAMEWPEGCDPSID